MEKEKDLEKEQLNILLDKGFKYQVDLFFGLKLNLEIKSAKLGTLDALSNEYVKINFDINEYLVDGRKEIRFGILKNTKILSKIIAIGTLNSYLKIKLFTGILSKILLWRLKPEQVFELAFLIENRSDLPNFVNSIRFLHVAQRTTSPNLIEEKALD